MITRSSAKNSSQGTPNLKSNGYEMTYKAWNNIGEVPYQFSKSSVELQGHTGQKNADFNLNWAFLDFNSSLNSPVALKWCTKVDVV